MSVGFGDAGVMRTGRPSLPGPGTVLRSAGCGLVIAAVLVLSSGRGAPAPEVGSSASQPLALAAGAFAPLPGAPVGTPARHDRSALGRAYGRLPLAFEANRGQFDRRAAFVARGAGYSLFLTKRSAVLSLAAGGSRGHKASRHAALTIGLVGASPRARLTGERGLPGKVNYLIGRNRSRWHTSVPTFGRVAYSGVWRGIGASFYGHGGQLEYDFNVAAGADPGRIGLSFAGAQSVAQAPGGALLVRLAGGTVRQLKPHAYQTVAGVRRTVASRYALERGRVGVRLGAYDHHRPLVIDPVLAYSTYLGGTGADNGTGIAVDAAGSAYVTGATGSTDFPVTPGAFQTKYPGQSSAAFISKLNPAGTALIYSTYLGGTTSAIIKLGDFGTGIAVDAAGSAYVTGRTTSLDFPTTPGAFQAVDPCLNCNSNAFVAKLKPDGAALQYSTYLGATGGGSTAGATEGNGIAVDSAGSAYATGNVDGLSVTEVAVFPTTVGAFQTGNFSGGTAGFVTKFNASGSGLVYSTLLNTSGKSNNSGNAVALDVAGRAYVTGFTDSIAFPTKNPVQAANGGGRFDAFVTALNAKGTALVYSTYLGGTGADRGLGIAVDSSGSAYATGITGSAKFPTTMGAYQTNYGGGSTSGNGGDAFVARFNGDGSLVFSTYLGGMGDDLGRGIALDSAGTAFITGGTASTNFPHTADAYQPTYGGGGDAFVTKLKADGTGLLYSTFLGGTGGDNGSGIAVDAAANPYITGGTDSTNFPTANPEQPGNAGNGDAFVAKFGPAPPPAPPTASTGAASSVSTGSATLNGTVNPSGLAASYHFEYGTSTSYGQSTPTQSAGADSQTHPESAAIAGLAPGTTYHFRIVATNSAGTSLGADQIFTTQASRAAPRAPQASTGPAESVSASAAKLTGTVNPNAQATSYRFDYGTSTSYGTSTPSQSAGAGSSNRSVTATIHGLKPGRTYHYRLLATSPAGTSSGGDRTFKTRPVKTRAACVVPDLHHKTLAQAKKLLGRHHCALGRVTRPKQNHSGRLVVVKQSPRSGSRRPGGTPVALTLAYLTRRVPVVPRFTG